jgi:hypothetical protein
VDQLGLAVTHMESAAAELEAQGAGPFMIKTGSPASWVEYGETRKVKGKLGLGYLHGIEMGLCEAGQGTDLYRETLDPEGEIVLHHIAFVVKDVDPWVERLTARKVPLRVRGSIKQGPLVIDFAYFDVQEETGLIIEIESFKMLGYFQWRPPAALYHTVGRLQKVVGRR